MERLDEGAPGTGNEKDDIGEPRDDGAAALDGGGGQFRPRGRDESAGGRGEGEV